MECEFNVASLSGTIISGDSRSLIFGPFNTAYRDLKQHLKLTSLQGLVAPTADSAISSDATTSIGSSNCWNVLCDVNAALEAATTASSPSGYAMDAISGSAADSILPSPPVSTASIRPFDQFQPVQVPFKAQHAPFETCPFEVAEGYIDNMKEREDDISRIKQQISSMVSAGQEAATQDNHLASSSSSSQDSVNMMDNSLKIELDQSSAGRQQSDDGTDSDSDVNSDASRVPPTLVATSMISKKFMAWLATSGQLHEVLDLIRIDNEIAQKVGGGKPATGPVDTASLHI